MVRREDPVSNFRLAIEIGGDIKGWFTDCSGLTIEREIYRGGYKEGGVNDYVHQLPDRIKYSNITLKHGLAGNELWDWFQKGLYDGQVERRNISIILYSTDLKKSKRWNLTDAYPVKWTGPNLNSAGNEVAVETLELVHHGLEMTDWT